MKRFQKLVKFWLPVFFWMGLIFFFSARPTPIVSEIDWRDFIFKKTIHLIEYGILFVLFYRALKNTSGANLKEIVIYSFILTFFYAVTDEFHQTFVHGRTGTVRDILIDFFGAGIAWGGIWRYLPKAPPKLKNLAKKLQII